MFIYTSTYPRYLVTDTVNRQVPPCCRLQVGRYVVGRYLVLHLIVPLYREDTYIYLPNIPPHATMCTG